jgi:ubiquitin-conjugating enzyme E2 J1
LGFFLCLRIRHFTIRGADGTDFEGGIYHGRILLPPEYPFKPPHIVFLTPSGRFETGTKVCLSFSAYHPELWQPAWGIRLILEALISFLPTPADGAIGALDWSSAERRRLAAKSVSFECPRCGRVANLLPPPRNKKEKDQKDQDASDGGDDGNKPSAATASTSRFAKEIEQLMMLQRHQHGPKDDAEEGDGIIKSVACGESADAASGSGGDNAASGSGSQGAAPVAAPKQPVGTGLAAAAPTKTPSIRGSDGSDGEDERQAVVVAAVTHLLDESTLGRNGPVDGIHRLPPPSAVEDLPSEILNLRSVQEALAHQGCSDRRAERRIASELSPGIVSDQQQEEEEEGKLRDSGMNSGEAAVTGLDNQGHGDGEDDHTEKEEDASLALWDPLLQVLVVVLSAVCYLLARKIGETYRDLQELEALEMAENN